MNVKKHCRILVALLLCAVFALTGCEGIVSELLSGVSVYETPQASLSESSTAVSSTPELQTTIPQWVADTDFANQTEVAASEICDNAIAEAIDVLRHTQVTTYDGSASAFDTTEYKGNALTAGQRGIYDFIYDNVSVFSDFEFDSKNHSLFSDFVTADDAFRGDHPELYLYYRSNVLKPTYTSHYIVPGCDLRSTAEDKQSVIDDVALFDAVCRRIMQYMPRDIGTYDKYRYLALVVGELCEYDNSLQTVGYPYPAYNAIMLGSAVCSGYAGAMRHLCRLSNLWCRTVKGTALGGEHMWNMVKLDGMTYYVDITWMEDCSPYGAEWRSQFMMTQQQAEDSGHSVSDGSIADGTPLPDDLYVGISR